MARANGRVFLKTDGGAKDLDRLVEREVSMTFYPNSVQSDEAITVSLVYILGSDEVAVAVIQNNRQHNERTIFEGRVSNREVPATT